MPATATLDPLVDDALLDALVPPPGPRWRRALLWLAFLGTVGLFVWATATGTVVPQVQTNVSMWGGRGPVGITTSISNDSPVAIELVEGPRPRDGLTLLGSTTGPVTTADMAPAQTPSDPFPLRLGPNERIDLTTWYRVDDCDAVLAIDPSDDQIDLQVRIASGPASWFTAERSIDATDLSMDTAEPVSWPAAVAWSACPH